LAARIRKIFEPHEMLPAAGQGALGIEVPSTRPEVMAALQPLAHVPTWWQVVAERAVSRTMGGSCSMPLAAFSTWVQPVAQGRGTLQLEAAWGDAEGTGPLLRSQGQAVVTSLQEADALGVAVAQQLIAAGAQVAKPAAPAHD
jgi:hydroxymethylbilane synthase